MTDKELIQALRCCDDHGCKDCPAYGNRLACDYEVTFGVAADRLEALLAENEHFREVTKMNAVEVVRCRDCKFFQTFGHSEKPFCQKFFGLLIKPDDFCSYGRKEEKNG